MPTILDDIARMRSILGAAEYHADNHQYELVNQKLYELAVLTREHDRPPREHDNDGEESSDPDLKGTPMKVARMLETAERFTETARLLVSQGEDSKALIQLIDLCRYLNGAIKQNSGVVLDSLEGEGSDAPGPELTGRS